MDVTVARVIPDPEVVERQLELFDLYNGWDGDGDPDDDPDFVDEARDIMGLPPFGAPSTSRSLTPEARQRDEDEDPYLVEIEEWAAQDPDEDFAEASRAAGHDVTLGHDELHHWWTQGPGLKRWAGSPTPWRTLLANLVEAGKDKPLETLKTWTSRWFIEVFGYAAGSDKNRVAHGHPPRGDKVGPG